MKRHTLTQEGFTLAEVLIVLAVIGVIAALTIPTLMSEWQSRANATKLRKFYSITAQALDLAKVKQGNLDTLDWGGAGRGGNGAALLAWFNSTFGAQMKIIESRSNENAIWYKTADGMSVFLDDFNIDSTYGINTTDTYAWYFYVDVNGNDPTIAVNPQLVGKSQFAFIYTNDRGLLPSGADNSSDCDSNEHSYACTARVLEKGTTKLD